MATNRKLILSFTRLLFAIRNGDVTETDLETALFYFGCAREHAYNPSEGDSVGSNELTWVIRDGEPEAEAQRLALHGIVLKALMKAEQEHRVIYRRSDERNSITHLNALLAANAYAPLRDEHGYYNYPLVAELVAEANLPLEIIGA